MKLELIEGWWTYLWGAFSARFNALGLLILGWFQFDPASVLWVWNLMPAAVSHALPPVVVAYVGYACFALALLSKLVKQPKLHAKIEAKTAEKTDASV